jgi:hypothetical protein
VICDPRCSSQQLIPNPSTLRLPLATLGVAQGRQLIAECRPFNSASTRGVYPDEVASHTESGLVPKLPTSALQRVVEVLRIPTFFVGTPMKLFHRRNRDRPPRSRSFLYFIESDLSMTYTALRVKPNICRTNYIRLTAFTHSAICDE